MSNNKNYYIYINTDKSPLEYNITIKKTFIDSIVKGSTLFFSLFSSVLAYFYSVPKAILSLLGSIFSTIISIIISNTPEDYIMYSSDRKQMKDIMNIKYEYKISNRF